MWEGKKWKGEKGQWTRQQGAEWDIGNEKVMMDRSVKEKYISETERVKNKNQWQWTNEVNRWQTGLAGKEKNTAAWVSESGSEKSCWKQTLLEQSPISP